MRMSVLPVRRGVRQDYALHCAFILSMCVVADSATLLLYQEQKSPRADHRDMGFTEAVLAAPVLRDCHGDTSCN